MVTFLSTGETVSTWIFIALLCLWSERPEDGKAATATCEGRRGQANWAGRDSNPHASRLWILSPARLPVPPPARSGPFTTFSDGGRPTVVERQTWTRITTT